MNARLVRSLLEKLGSAEGAKGSAEGAKGMKEAGERTLERMRVERERMRKAEEAFWAKAREPRRWLRGS